MLDFGSIFPVPSRSAYKLTNSVLSLFNVRARGAILLTMFPAAHTTRTTKVDRGQCTTRQIKNDTHVYTY